MNKTCYVTTPIYYASGSVHIGNSYSTLVADGFARFHRMKGYETRFLTGMDEHGQKIEEAAKKNNTTPQEYVNKIAEETKILWEKLNISNDDFIQTSEERHSLSIQQIFEKLLNKGDIYLGSYEGDYCVSCETFFTKTQLNEDGSCPDCGKMTRKVKEESYFFNMKKYVPRLLEYIENHNDFIQPETRRNEVISFLKSGVDDLCATRTSFTWGVKVLSNPKHVVYVWIDALCNYITSLGYGTKNDDNFNKFWLNGEKVVHIVGKDILRFHAVIWPIILMALDIPINYTLYVHGWYLMKDGKMSKSRGNMIYPLDVVERYGLDAFRYYMMKEMPLGTDALFSYERFIDRYNSDLANDYGNLISRTIAMAMKYFGGNAMKANSTSMLDDDFIKLMAKTKDSYDVSFSNFRIQQAITEVCSLISRSNKYVDETTPWALQKDPSKQERLNDVIYNLLESIRIATILLSPIMPDATNVFKAELGLKEDEMLYENAFYGYKKQYSLNGDNTVIFQRLDVKKELEYQANKILEKEDMESKNYIKMEDFAKIGLKVGEIVEANTIANAEKLLVLKVNIEGKVRQIVSGIAKHYNKDNVIGRKVVVVSNLAPVKIRGVMSEGMILCASDGEKIELLEVHESSVFSKVS